MTDAQATLSIRDASTQAAREVRRDSPIRRARTCYDHLAGVAGVELMDSLLQEGWLEEQGQSKGRIHYRLTPMGESAFTRRGIDLSSLSSLRRMYAYGCVDWTERRFHLGGALGAAVLRLLAEAGILRRGSETRVVALLKPINKWINGTA